ncbi:MAG: hypothetical protein LBD01_02365 [Puniceicoccales bacterium]|jgi:hypothetical protein|nr:hypothetical protein [Puniceicoccales bacterium]
MAIIQTPERRSERKVIVLDPLGLGGSRKSPRRWRRFLVGLLLVLLALGLIGGLGYMAWLEMMENQPVITRDTLRFETDEQLSSEWLMAYLKLSQSEPVNLVELEEKLLRHGQIAAVSIKRLPGDREVSVKIRERKPLLRLRENLPGGYSADRMVSADGVVYSGVNYPQAFVAKLPWLVEAVLKPSPGGEFSTIAGMGLVSELVVLARDHFPELYKDWAGISMRDLRDGNLGVAGVCIRVRLRSSVRPPQQGACIRDLIFSANATDFRQELFNIYGQESVRTAVNENLRKATLPLYDWDLAFKNRLDPRNPKREPRLTPVAARQRPPPR